MLKQIKTLSALALSFLILATASAQDFVKELKVQSAVSKTRVKELQAAVESLTEEQVHKKDYKFIFTKALESWKKVNRNAITSVLMDKPITGIHELALKEAVAYAEENVTSLDLDKLKKEAEEKFPAYVVGSTIENQPYAPTPTRLVKVSGKIKFVNKDYIKVGFRDYKITDFKDPLFRQGLSPIKTRQARHNHVVRAQSVVDAERNEIISEKYPEYFDAKVAKNEDSGFILIADQGRWATPDVLLKPMIEDKIVAIEKIIDDRVKAAEIAQLEILKRENKVKKVLLGVNEEFIIQFEKLVIKDLIKAEENAAIEAEKRAKAQAEIAAQLEAEEKAKAEAAAAAAELKKKQAEAKKKSEAKKRAEQAAEEEASQNQMYAIIGGGVVATVFIFLFVNPKTRDMLFNKKKKSLDQVTANLAVEEETSVEEDTTDALTVDEQLDGGSKGSINLGVVPGHAPEQESAPTLEAPTLEPPTLQAPGKSTGKPSLIINPDLQVKTDEASKLKLKK